MVGATTRVVAEQLLDGDVNLVGGTAWFWTRADVAQAVDVLVVDEAGQFSLANAVAVARGARSMVLLGDPQQLAQPTPGGAPGGVRRLGAGAPARRPRRPSRRTAGSSSTGRTGCTRTSRRSCPTWPTRAGSRRRTGRERVAVLGEGPLSGSGLRVHAGAARADGGGQEPAGGRRRRAAVALGAGLDVAQPPRAWRRRSGRTQVLVVAPYNAQVALIKAALPGGARVGTVDKFQGQEAPVVIYSMTSTSADDAPRGVVFLYDLNRLNVAVSRAQALAVVVLSPLLLDAPVRTPDQLRRVNALCRLVESASGRRVA